MNLTPRQLEILDFIRDFRRMRRYSPTLEEIGRHFGVSKVTVLEHVRALERKGAVRHVKYVARSIEPVVDVGRKRGARLLPLVGHIAAGQPIEAVEVQDTIDVEEMLASDKEQFVLQVRGDSMIEEQRRDGDYVVIERRNWARNGETVVALVNGEEATLKKFYHEGGRIRLQPANPAMKPIYAEDVQVQGVVIGLLRKY